MTDRHDVPERRSSGARGPRASRPAAAPRPTADQQKEMDGLRDRLEEAEETLSAIQAGAVDAFLVKSDDGDKVYTLQGAERPYQMLVESMQQGALVLSTEGRVLFANGRVSELLGIPLETIQGHRFAAWVAPLNERTFARVLVAGSARDVKGELELVRGDGARVPVHITASPLPLDGATVMIAILTDLTRERAHAALERAHEASRASVEELRVADRRKDEFLASLAHELRNPLAPVRNLVEVLRKKGAATPDVEWAQNVIDRQIQRMARLVDELLDLSGIAHDQIELQKAPVILGEVLNAALEASGEVLEQWGTEVIVTMPEAPVELHADRARLVQVFSNLLTNAANATSRFGRVEVSAREDGDSVEVSVKDNGAGIPAEQLPHIFDMFARLDRSVKGEQTSLGIGLALVRCLVTLHGGSVEARSDGPGEGSEFIVRLPVAAAAAAPAWTGDAGVSAHRRILVVDDNGDTADSLAAMLRMHGHEVRSVYDGRTAVQVGQAFEPDVVLLDIGMPDMDGYATCAAIRGCEWGERTHIFAITGWGQPDVRRRAEEAGCDDLLTKPVDPGSLTGRLSALQRRRTPWSMSSSA